MSGTYLAIRIYLIAVVEIAVSVAGAVILWLALLPREIPTPSTVARYVADHVADVADDPQALEREIARARSVPVLVDVFDSGGERLSSGASPIAASCWPTLPDDGAGTMAPEGYCFARRRVLTEGGAAYVVTRAPRFPPLTRVLPTVVGFPLLVIAIASIVVGRSVSVPLKRIAATAGAFGGGRLDARVRLRRRDELGQVARAFDDMADRIVELVQAERELIANVSHELRSPLARTRVALDLAAEGDSSAARQALLDISGDIEELERIVTDVLAVARLGLNASDAPWTASASPPLRWQGLEIGKIVDSAVNHFRSRHPERNVVVSCAGVVQIQGDPVLLRRVLDNLLENAHKYTESPDEAVDVDVDVGDRVRLRVVDRGIGIAPDDLTHVFRPFFRSDRSRTRTTGGLGLGLTLVRRIVEAHGGEVHLESTIGSGTVVTILLPLATAFDTTAIPHWSDS